jgi:hypothetical protein
MYKHLASYTLAPRASRDPAFEAVEDKRRRQMLAAVEPFTEDWTPTEREMAAALLDVLKSVGTYVRLVEVWSLDNEHAMLAATGLLGLLTDVIRDGDRPWLGR